jgi:hypothetical protein
VFGASFLEFRGEVVCRTPFPCTRVNKLATEPVIR